MVALSISNVTYCYVNALRNWMLWNREIVSAKDIFLMIASIWLLRRLDQVNFFFFKSSTESCFWTWRLSGGGFCCVFFYLYFYFFITVCLVFLVVIFSTIEMWGASVRAMCLSIHLLKWYLKISLQQPTFAKTK